MYKDWYRIPVLHYGLECVGQSVAYLAHYVYLRDVWIRTPESFRSKQARYQLSPPSPYLATHLPKKLHAILYRYHIDTMKTNRYRYLGSIY